MLRCFFGEHSQDVLLHEHRYGCNKAQVLWVSMKNNGSGMKWKAKWWDSCYFVLLEHIAKMLRFLISDFVVSKVKCCECLWKIMDQWWNRKQSGEIDVTLFCWSALARCSNLLASIGSRGRWSSVSVCVNELNKDWRRMKSVISYYDAII
jgi:hypothetical protein